MTTAQAPAPTAVRPFRSRCADGVGWLMRLHPGQQKAWDSQARTVCILAGAQSGKTCFGPHWLLREIATRGPGDYLVATATFPLLELKLLPEFLEVFRGAGTYQSSTHTFQCKPESRVIFVSATNPEAAESATAKAAWLDEAGQKQFRRETWEAVQRRLAVNQGRILITTTPYTFAGWLKSEIYDRCTAGDRDIEIIQFDSRVNPAFPASEYQRQRELLPTWKFDLFYRGRFAKPAGLVYDCFDRPGDVIPAFPLPMSWPVFVGHDFGAVNAAAVLYAQDPATGILYLFGAYKPGVARSVGDHVAEWQKLTAGRSVVRRVGGSHQESENRQAYAAHGWPITEPRVRSVEAGIQHVYGMHKRRRVMVFAGLESYLDEIESYSYKLGDDYRATEEIEDKETYHLMDAERYLLTDLPSDTVPTPPASRQPQDYC